jgi:hypothetical protein
MGAWISLAVDFYVAEQTLDCFLEEQDEKDRQEHDTDDHAITPVP